MGGNDGVCACMSVWVCARACVLNWRGAGSRKLIGWQSVNVKHTHAATHTHTYIPNVFPQTQHHNAFLQRSVTLILSEYANLRFHLSQ